MQRYNTVIREQYLVFIGRGDTFSRWHFGNHADIVQTLIVAETSTAAFFDCVFIIDWMIVDANVPLNAVDAE